MSRIPSTQKLIVENFPEQREWIGAMFQTINKFIGDVVTAINGGIEFGVNIQGKEFEYDFVYQSHATTFPQSFQWTLVSPPKALYVTAAFENNPSLNRNFTPIIALVNWSYTADNQVQITDCVKLAGNTAAISDLTAGRRYKIKTRVTP